MDIYNFSQKDIDICNEFSNNVDTTFYSKRNQFDANKRKLDTKIGKLGELVVYNTLIKTTSDISYPDFKIYDAKSKSWDFDLKSSSMNIHVKTQEVLQSSKYGESWIFQNEDKKIFKTYSENDFVAFVLVDILNKNGQIRKLVKLKDLHDKNLFKKPKLIHLSSKSAVYYEDLEEAFKDD